jgi:hypothetical protein
MSDPEAGAAGVDDEGEVLGISLPTIITWGLLRQIINGVMEQAVPLYSTLSDFLLGLESKTASPEVVSLLFPTIPLPSTCECSTSPSSPSFELSQQAAIICSDSASPNLHKSAHDILPQISTLISQSFIGASSVAMPLLYCVGWPIKGKLRFTGPFGRNTSNPILFLSNTLDPATPHRNAVEAVKKYEGASLLTIDSLGHTSQFVPSDCADRYIAAYLINGTLLEDGTLCAPSELSFGVDVRNAPHAAAQKHRL